MDNLTDEVLERLGPEGVFDVLKPFIPSLAPPRNGSVEVRALCPFHADHEPSWCWNLAKGIANCVACGQGNCSMFKLIADRTQRRKVDVLDEFCRRFGLTRPRKRTLTVADYAVAKKLPEEFLREQFHLTDGADGVQIPYLDAKGEIVARRYRRSLGTKPRWRRGERASRQVYGLHGCERFTGSQRVFGMEGESDVHAAWHHSIPAWATPGAHVGHKAFAERVLEAGFREVYLVPDADDAGQAFVQKLDRALQRAGFAGSLLVVSLPADDVSDLHNECGSTFSAAFDVAVQRAQTVADFTAEREQTRVTARTDLAKIVENVLRTKRSTNTTDKVILIAAARIAANDPAGRIPMSNSRLAKTAGIPRRTLQSRLPGLLEAGLLRRHGDGLRLGEDLLNGLER